VIEASRYDASACALALADRAARALCVRVGLAAAGVFGAVRYLESRLKRRGRFLRAATWCSQ